MTETRIYVVMDKAGESGEVRLVRCASQAQARNHVNKDKYKVRVASQEDLETFLSAGKKVEVAAQE